MRLREEALASSVTTQQTITKRRATLREAGGIAAEGRASEVPLLSTIAISGARGVEAGETEGDQRATARTALERLKPGGNPGAEEWLDEVLFACFLRVVVVLVVLVVVASVLLLIVVVVTSRRGFL